MIECKVLLKLEAGRTCIRTRVIYMIYDKGNPVSQKKMFACNLLQYVKYQRCGTSIARYQNFTTILCVRCSAPIFYNQANLYQIPMWIWLICNKSFHPHTIRPASHVLTWCGNMGIFQYADCFYTVNSKGYCKYREHFENTCITVPCYRMTCKSDCVCREVMFISGAWYTWKTNV